MVLKLALVPPVAGHACLPAPLLSGAPRLRIKCSLPTESRRPQQVEIMFLSSLPSQTMSRLEDSGTVFTNI